MPITDILEKNCRLYGDDVALVEINPEMPETKRTTWKEFDLIEPSRAAYYRREITWNVFNEKANRFANLLVERGIKKGEKVGILLMNCLEWLPIYFGILKTGALAVPLNFRYSADEIKYCVELAEIDILVFGPEFIGRVEEIADEIGKGRLLYFVGDGCPGFAEDYNAHTANCSSQSPKIDVNDDDDAAIYFSSGTTGFPKAILHNHESLMHAAKAEQNHHGQTKDDVFLCIPPLYHTGAKMHWFGSLLTGGKAVLLKGTSPKTILQAVSEEHCTIVWLLVPWAQDLLLALDNKELDIADYDLDQWRLMHIGAQPVPPSLIKHWKEYFPNHKYDTNYGLSESIGPGCVHLGVDNIDKVGAIGKAGYGWETKIIDEQGEPVKQGETGELAVKGPGVMTCYYRDPRATAEVLHDGWLYTGDMAMVVNGKLSMKPDSVKALEQYCGIVVNGKLYCPESLVSAVTAKCTVNGKVCIYPDDAVILNSTTKLDKTFLLRAQAKLYWAERMFVAVDPKLDAEALAAKGARFAAPKAILTESNAETLAPLFTEETELVILPDGTAFLDDDLELSASALRRNGDRLYVMGDVTIPEKAGELLEKIEYLHAEGTIFLPDTLEEAVDVIPELEYQELRVLHGHALIGKPMLWLGKEMLDLYPDGVTCVDCAMVKLDKALEPDTIAKKFVFDGCAMVFCTELQQNAVSAVSKNVAQIQTGLAKEETDDTVRLDGIQLTL